MKFNNSNAFFVRKETQIENLDQRRIGKKKIIAK